MRVTMHPSELLVALNIAKVVIPRRSSLPVVSNVILETRGSELRVRGTDLDTFVTVHAPVDSVEKEGAITVPARLLADALAAMYHEVVTLTAVVGASTASLTIDGLNRESVTLDAMPLSDAPEWPAIPALAPAFDLPSVRYVADKVAFCASTEETRPILNTVHMHAHDGRLRIVATNGHRLAEATVDAEVPPKLHVLLHPKAFEAADAAFGRGPVKVEIGDRHARLSAPGGEVVSRLVEGPYPNYTQVFPKAIKTVASLARRDLLEALNLVLVTASEQTHRTQFSFTDDSLAVSSALPGVGSATTRVKCGLDGPALRIGFNGAYLSGVLEAMDAEVIRIEMVSPERAIVLSGVVLSGVEPGDPRYLIMPLRLLD